SAVDANIYRRVRGIRGRRLEQRGGVCIAPHPARDDDDCRRVAPGNTRGDGCGCGMGRRAYARMADERAPDRRARQRLEAWKREASMRRVRLLCALVATTAILTLALSAQEIHKVDVSKLGPQVGAAVPDFTLADQHGKKW